MKFSSLWRVSLPSQLRGDSCGQSLIEVALLLPIVFLLTFGLVQFCLLVFSLGNANFACRVASRYASVHSLSSYTPATQQNLLNVIAPYIYPYPSNTYGVTVSYVNQDLSRGTNTVGCRVIVTLRVAYPVNIFGQSFTPFRYESTGVGTIVQ